MIKFCDNCLSDVNCVYDEGILNETLDGFNVSYLEKYYVCDVCGEKFYDDLSDYNTSTAHNALKEVVIDDNLNNINELMDKYSLGKKPLSLILNMGEVTIPRYFAGSIPTREHADLIRAVNKYPLLMEMYLKYNKDKLTNVAYKKAIGKVAQLSLLDDDSTIYKYAVYLLKRDKEITPLCIQKVLFFIDGVSKFNNKIDFCTKLNAWKFGPVYPDIYECFSYFKASPIEYNEIFKDFDVDLTDEEKKFIDEVYEAFGCYSSSMLVEMTHLTDPWIKAREGLSDDDNTTVREISRKDMDEYFTRMSKEYNSIEDYARGLFEQVKNNRKK
jgi:uncharacterized phage-associated protein